MAIYNRRAAGNIVEQQAIAFLQKKGLRLLSQNYQCRHGEIDIIMQDHDDIVFVEVRSRTNANYGDAFDSIHHKKIQKLLKTAKLFLQVKNWTYTVNSRFDVIAYHPIAGKMQLEWLKNAFDGIKI